MLSFSLRRKSAPGSLNIRDGCPSPVKQSGPPTPSVSSKKSLSSLFPLATKDGSPRTTKPTDETDILEKDLYPIYDAGNPNHDPSAKTLLKISRRRSRSSSRKRSTSGTGTILDTLASKMRAATEFFHKSTNKTVEADNKPESPAPPRSVSPKKSVRFRSSTSSHGHAKSSPIDVPKKSAPSLPQLELPRAAFGTSLDQMGTTPIPTGRPPSTPMLKGREGDSYFPCALEPKSFMDFKHTIRNMRPSPTPAHVGKPAENPFDDNAAIVEQPQRMSPSSSTPSVVSSGSLNARHLRHLTSSSEKSNQTSATLWEEGIDNKQKSRGGTKTPDQSNMSAGEPLTLADSSAEAPADYIPPSAQVSYAIVHSPTPQIADDPSHRPQTKPAAESAWSLESRNFGEKNVGDNTSDSDDMHAEPSTSASPRRSNSRKPTHEDIRRQFRSSRTCAPAGLREESSSSVGSGVECEASISELPEESISCCLIGGLTYPYIDCTHKTFDKGMLSHMERPTESASLTDPEKLPPQTTSKQSASEQAIVVPEDTVSPLNLKSNISSTSPSRTRRPFRFSNSTDKDSQASPIGSTSFSWHAKESEETIKAISEFHNQTPSPVSVPLPLSIAPKKFSLPNAHERYIDQHGWSPFNEKHFPDVLLNAERLHHLLHVEGGFATFWDVCGLPTDSRPMSDTRHLSPSEIKSLVETASHIRGLVESPEPLEKALSPNIMDQMCSPWVRSSDNKFATLSKHRKDYSGLSTVDPSTTGEHLEAGTIACSDTGCEMCVTRESYESSNDLSILGSGSGYESDMETSNKEAMLSSIHTPTRLPRPVAGDKTPKQTDFGRLRVHALQQSYPKHLRSSEASDASSTVSTIAYMSEDEKFAQGIV